MARLVINAPENSLGYPQIFTQEGGGAGNFTFDGPDPEIDKNELLYVDLADGTYYLVLDVCDESGQVTGRTLEHLVVHGDVVNRMEMADRATSVECAGPAQVRAAFAAHFAV
jgi:hypothetical protein